MMGREAPPPDATAPPGDETSSDETAPS
jgi:hypothetical protein